MEVYIVVYYCSVRGAEDYDPEQALSLAKWFFALKDEQKMKLATKVTTYSFVVAKLLYKY